MRLFVAVTPSAAALDEIATAIDRVRSLAPDLRWTSAAQWHLTLAFLGDVNADRLPELSTRLQRAASRHQPIRLAFGAAGKFDGRVRWLSVQGDRPALAALAGSAAAAARRSGIPIEDRRYRPHLTLARSSTPVSLTGLVAELGGFSGSAWTAVEVALIQSQLGQGPPRYQTVERWPLGRGLSAVGR